MIITKQKAALGGLCIFGIGFILGMWFERYTAKPLIVTEEKKVIEEKIITETETQIAYVPKEIIRYVDKVTGKEESAALDGKFTFDKPEFIYTVNGKPAKFTRSDEEKFIFDKNMLELKQQSVIKIETEIPAIDKTKNFAIGIGAGNHGAAIVAAYKNYWVYGDKETRAAGIEVKF